MSDRSNHLVVAIMASSDSRVISCTTMLRTGASRFVIRSFRHILQSYRHIQFVTSEYADLKLRLHKIAGVCG